MPLCLLSVIYWTQIKQLFDNREQHVNARFLQQSNLMADISILTILSPQRWFL